jgi:hypothetical protein
MEARFGASAPAAARLATDPDVGLLLSPLVTRSTIEELSRAQSVARADLGGLRWLDEAALRDVPRLCGPALRELVLDHCPAASDAVLRQAAASCAQLTALSLRGCPRVTLAGVNHVLRRCAALRALDLSRNAALLDAPAPARDDDLVQLYYRSVPKGLRPDVAIRTAADSHDPVAEADRQARLFCRLLAARSLAVLELQDVRGVNDALLERLCVPTAPAVEEFDDDAAAAAALPGDGGGAAHVPSSGAATAKVAAAAAAPTTTATSATAREMPRQVGPPHGASGVAALQRVNLAGTDVGDAGLRRLAATCPKLDDVSVAMTRVGPAGVRALAQHCGELVHLDLAGLALDDACVAELLASQAGLRTLDLAGCSGVTMDLAPLDLAHSVLERIDLTACPAVRAHGLAALLCAPRLYSVVLNACYQLDRAALDELNAQGRARTPRLAFTRAKDRAPGDALCSGLVEGWRPGATLRAAAREGGGPKSSGGKGKK